MPPPKEVEFCINLVSLATPVSRAAHRMPQGELLRFKDLIRQVVGQRIHKTEYVPMGGPCTLCKEE